MKFTCPYQNLQNHLFEIRSPWDYFNHLQKCHIINEEILKSQKNSYFVCPFCLQLFEHQSERDLHMEACSICNFKPLFKDINMPIMIGKQGTKQLKAIIEFYKEMITSHEEEPQKTVVPQPLPEEVPKPKLNQLNLRSINVQKQKRKLEIDLMNNRVTLTGACFKIYHDYTLELINKQFDLKVPSSSILKFLSDRGIELTTKNYKLYLICEFMDDNEERSTSDTFVKINTVNQLSTIWVLLNEESCPFKDITFNQPWHMLSMQTSMKLSEFKELSVGEALLNELLEEKQKQEELTKQAVERYHYLKNEQLEIDTQTQIRKKRIEKLDLDLNEMRQRLVKINLESKSIQEQANQIAQKKLIKAQEDLEKHFIQQMETEKNKLGNSDISNKLEKSRKKRDGMCRQINELNLKKKNAIFQLDQLNIQIEEDLIAFEKEQHKMCQGVEQQQIITREQVINQQLCIKCKQQNREIIQKPCSHFLFCEQCYKNELENNRYFNCPLADIGQCKDGNLEKKYKKIKI